MMMMMMMNYNNKIKGNCQTVTLGDYVDDVNDILKKYYENCKLINKYHL